MEDLLDELVDFLLTSDELTLPAALMHDNDKLLAESGNLPTVVSTATSPASPSQGSNSVGPTDGRPKRSKDAIRRCEYRKRRKAEKEALRQEINTLSAKLNKLQNTWGEGASSPSTAVALSTCLWRAIASRQKEYRQAAEDEQLHLRAAITSRAALIEDLAGVVRQRAHEGTIVTNEFENAPRLQKRMCLKATDTGLFETFLQELHTVYLQTDHAIRVCEVAAATDMPLITKCKDGATVYYQHAERQVLPFQFESTCRSIWHLAQLKHRQEDRRIYEGLGDPENTLAIKFHITSRRKGRTMSLSQRVVIRRYEENHRVVTVWKVLTEGQGLFRGMHSHETGWVIIRPSTTETGGCTGTILDTCFRNVPMHFGNSSLGTPVVDEFTDLVIRTGEEDSQILFQGLENMLLDDELEQFMS